MWVALQICILLTKIQWKERVLSHVLAFLFREWSCLYHWEICDELFHAGPSFPPLHLSLQTFHRLFQQKTKEMLFNCSICSCHKVHLLCFTNREQMSLREFFLMAPLTVNGKMRLEKGPSDFKVSSLCMVPYYVLMVPVFFSIPLLVEE